jgi:hypothetical protein
MLFVQPVPIEALIAAECPSPGPGTDTGQKHRRRPVSGEKGDLSERIGTIFVVDRFDHLNRDSHPPSTASDVALCFRPTLRSEIRLSICGVSESVRA